MSGMSKTKRIAGMLGAAASVMAFGIAQASDAQASGISSAPSMPASGLATPKLFRSVADGADAPSGRGILRMPSSNDAGNDAPRAEGEAAPAEPGDTDGDDDTSGFFGQDVFGNTVFILDVSASMMLGDMGAGEDCDGNAIAHMTRLDVVKVETIRTLNTLSESDWFDFVLLAGAEAGAANGTVSSPLTDVWQGELVQATEMRVGQAIAYVQGLATWWGTPTYACMEYGNDLDRVAFLSDGQPFPFEIASGNHIESILRDFPEWFAPLREQGCALSCIHIGHNQGAGTFMQTLAAQNGATYVHITGN
ncbi:MAG: hypothetical protein L6Q71_04505 [Planctomycetes bacterium]|nr:hypothetical protein [Planctomycetota bacterium]